MADLEETVNNNTIIIKQIQVKYYIVNELLSNFVSYNEALHKYDSFLPASVSVCYITLHNSKAVGDVKATIYKKS